MTKSPRARLLEIDERIRLLKILCSGISEDEHVPNVNARNVFDSCVDGCPACEKLTRYNSELGQLGREQQELFLQVAVIHVRKDTSNAVNAKKEGVKTRQQWLSDAIERAGLDKQDINNSRRDRATLRTEYKRRYDLSNSSFRNDLKALGYDPK